MKIKRNGSSERNGDHIKVVVRSRPMNEEEKRLRQPCLVACDQENRTVAVSQMIGGKRAAKTYTFDTVFGPYSTQDEVFKTSVQPIVEDVLLGFNCTVFAYGQTGTGKTYTMEGDLKNETKRGMIPRAVNSLFEKLPTDGQSEFSAKVSFLELYNEELFDLLTDGSLQNQNQRSGPGVRLVDDKSKQVCCQNLTEILVNSSDDVLEAMEKALSRRQTAETKLNKHSSRSHCIFTLTLHIRERTVEGEDLVKVGKLNLVDLAGSESVGRAGGNDVRMREAGNINKSLLTLGRVITALVEKTPHIPYRDSKLTRLLQESLGGRAKTLVIATVGPSLHSLEETISTLDYASRAKSIKNKPKANKKLTKHELIKEYVEDMERMRRELEAARSKDGVWLSLEQYEGMKSEIESQENNIKSMEKGLNGRETELIAKQEEITSLKQTLKQREELISSLKVIKKELEETVKEKERIIEEDNFIIKKYRETEEKLIQQKSELNQVLEVCKSDICLLEEKVMKQERLESENKNNLSEYTVKLTEQVDIVEKLRQEYELSFKKDNKKLREILKTQNLDRQEINKEITTSISLYNEKLLSKQQSFIQELEQSLNTKGIEELNKIEPKLGSFLKDLKDNFEIQRDYITEFETDMKDIIQHELIFQKNTFLSIVDEQKLKLMNDSYLFTQSLTEMKEKYLVPVESIIVKNEAKIKEIEEKDKESILNDIDQSEKEKEELMQLFQSKFDEIEANRKKRLTERLSRRTIFRNEVKKDLEDITQNLSKYEINNQEVIEREKKTLSSSLDKVTESAETFKLLSERCEFKIINNVDEYKTAVISSINKNSNSMTEYEVEQTELVNKVVVDLCDIVEVSKEKNIKLSTYIKDTDISLRNIISTRIESEDKIEKDNDKVLVNILDNNINHSKKKENFHTTVKENVIDYKNNFKIYKRNENGIGTPKNKKYPFNKTIYKTEDVQLLREIFRNKFESNVEGEGEGTDTSLVIEVADNEKESEQSVEPLQSNTSLKDIFDNSGPTEQVESDENQGSEEEEGEKENESPNFDSLKVKELRALLAKKGLSQVGRKEELKRRLIENYNM